MIIIKNKKPIWRNWYLLLIFITTLFMGIGYAKISDASLNISGIAEALQQEGVFISDVQFLSSNGADTTSSKINGYAETMLDSNIVLGSTSDSTITYEISIYNNSDKENMFIGVLTDKEDDTLYSNLNIEYNVNIEEYTTRILPQKSIKFTLTFKYKSGADLTNNTLISKLNFRFQEVPTLILSNEGESYTLSDIYPDYTPKEYEFTVSNYDSSGTNNVPMTYSLDVTIDSPLTAKIYDELGNEVGESITLDGDGVVQVNHTYVLKIIWDSSNPDGSIGYNSSDYENKEFVCNVTLNAKPDSDKYLDYSITKNFNVNITTATMYFNISANQNIKVEKAGSDFNVTLKNYSSDNAYNNFDIAYDLSIIDNSKFTYTIGTSSPVNDVFSRALSGNEVIDDSFTIRFSADINNLSVTENATLKISIKSPYVKEITLPLTISLQPVTVTLNANGGVVSPGTITVYKGKTYSSLPTPTWLGHTFNGWFTTATGGTQVLSTNEVTTSSSTQTIYAHWTSHLLADNVQIGDYVDYEYVYYNNVSTNSSNSYTPQTTFVNWRVLSTNDLDGDGVKEVRLITAGVPMTYVFNRKTTVALVQTEVNNITTNFFNTAFASTSTTSKFYKNGFYKKLSDGTTQSITTMASLKTAFTNEYTQTNSSGVPLVQSITKNDLDAVVGQETTDGNDLTGNGDLPGYNNLFAIPAQSPSGQYAAYYVAGYSYYSSYTEPYHMWNVRYLGAIVGTQGEHGVRPVVTLKESVIKVDGSGTTSDPYTLDVAE